MPRTALRIEPPPAPAMAQVLLIAVVHLLGI